MAAVSDGPIYAESRGEGPPLVFIHGAWVSRQMWAPQVDTFGDDHRVVTFDIRGHGRTGRPEGRPLTVDLFTEDLRELLDSLDIEAPVLCGLSLGGLIAKRYAIANPGAVRGLFLADTVRSVPPVPFPRTSVGKELFIPKVPLYSMVRTVGPTAVYRYLLAVIEGTSGKPWIVKDRVREYVLGEVSRFGASEFVQVVDSLYDYEPRDSRAIDVPTAIAIGDHETPPITAQNKAMARRIDGADLSVIPEAGHLSNLDNPGAFNRTLEAFLDEAC